MRRSFRPRLAAQGASLALALISLAGCGSGADTRENTPPQSSQAPDTIPPTAPTSLTAAAVDRHRIDLSWSPARDAVGVAGYRIYRDGGTGELATVTATTYSDTRVVPGTIYAYAVRAFDAAGNASELSAPARTTTPPETTAIIDLDSRPTNASCVASPPSATSTQVSLERFTNLEFVTPVGMLQAPGDSSRWFVLQQDGLVAQFSTNDPSSASTFLDLRSRVRSGGEMGLLGMAFHPAFPQDPRVFVSYTSGTSLVSHISAFLIADQGATLDAASEQILLTVDQPETNHNGGHIAFGPDGYLYIGMGDGGGGGDGHGATGNGQRLTTLLGKMLRIDVNSGSPYTIPPSNPFAQNAICPAAGRASGECPEIYAWGLRNPWRWSFDRSTGELWVADVGQSRYEEVNLVTLGGNYGWRCREGAHDFSTSDTPGCATSPLIDPVTEYGRDFGASITGGYVYRGAQHSGLSGRYIFGDFASGWLFAWIAESAGVREPTLLLESGLNISSFAQGNDGELYVVDYGGGLYRLVFAGGTSTAAPDTLPVGCRR